MPASRGHCVPGDIIMFKAALLLSAQALAESYGEPILARLRARVDQLTVISPGALWPQHVAALAEVEVIFSGWGAPLMDENFLRHAPKLKAVFYAGGSVRYFVTEALWQRGIRLTTAQALNAIPVAEYTVAALVLGLKRFWHYARLTREERTFAADRPMPGVLGTTIGLVSYGTIGRLVRQRLRGFEVNVLVYDPCLGREEAEREGMRKVELDELFAEADAVSVHTPLLPETAGLLKGRHFELLKPGAFFLNTARGEIVDEAEMIAVLGRRPEVQAVLDVTAPEPPAPDSPLYRLPNVAISPHIAGSVGRECQRMGQAMLAEFERYRSGQPLQWEVTAEQARSLA